MSRVKRDSATKASAVARDVTRGIAVRMLFRRVVIQVLPKPSLDLSHAHPFAFVIVGDLIAVDLAEA
jgi:hypothetical protein